MNDMTHANATTALKHYSAGKISRIELGRLIGAPISFGDMLMMLHEADLPLPRYGKPFNPEGIKLLREALSAKKRG